MVVSLDICVEDIEASFKIGKRSFETIRRFELKMLGCDGIYGIGVVLDDTIFQFKSAAREGPPGRAS